MNKYQCPKCERVTVMQSKKPTLMVKCCDGDNLVEVKLNNQAVAKIPDVDTVWVQKEILIEPRAPEMIAPGMLKQKQNVARVMTVEPTTAIAAVADITKSSIPVSPVPASAPVVPPTTVTVPLANPVLPAKGTIKV